MPSAGLTSLYTGASLGRNIDYNDVYSKDIKSIVSILRDYPSNPDSSPHYWKTTKKAIKDLPHHLRSSRVSLTHSTLCAGHSGLNDRFIDSIWAIIRHELEGGVGRFLYPIIMHAGLPAWQEERVRLLEPVSEMWQEGFDIKDHTPAGRHSIRPLECVNGVNVPKWRRQEDGCAACMLARIGSDKDILFVLLAGIIGRCRSRVIGTKKHIKSKRVQWVRKWLKKFPNGEKLVDEAWEHGMELKRVRNAWKEHTRRNRGRSRGLYGRQAAEPVETHDFAAARGSSSRVSGIGVDRSIVPPTSPTALYPPVGTAGKAEKDRSAIILTVSDAGIGENKTPIPQNPQSPAESAYKATHRQPPALPAQPTRDWQPTAVRASSVYSTDDDEAPLIHNAHGQSNTTQRPASAMPSIHSQVASVYGADEIEWETPTQSEIGEPMATKQQTIRFAPEPPREHQSLRPPPLRIPTPGSTHRSSKEQPSEQYIALPNPNRKSIYAGYADADEGVDDETPPGSPVVVPEGPLDGPGHVPAVGESVNEVRARMTQQTEAPRGTQFTGFSRDTQWGDLY